MRLPWRASHRPAAAGIAAASAAPASARTPPRAEDGAPPAAHRAAFQVGTDDRRAQVLILGNVCNDAKHFKDRSEPFAVEIVAFGPGFAVVRGDLSTMEGDLEALQKELGPSLAVSACRNTRAAIAASEGKAPEAVPLLPSVGETPSGVVRLAGLLGRGWAYIRP